MKKNLSFGINNNKFICKNSEKNIYFDLFKI